MQIQDIFGMFSLGTGIIPVKKKEYEKKIKKISKHTSNIRHRLSLMHIDNENNGSYNRTKGCIQDRNKTVSLTPKHFLQVFIIMHY